MKICEIKYLLNNLPLLLENMSLGEVKKRIKNNTLKVDSADKEWYNNENNRKELIDTITYANTTGHLKNFNTGPYLKNKTFFPVKLMTELELKLAEIESKKFIERGKNNFDSVTIGNDITVYAPYTPEANTKLAYKGVVKGRDPYPTWCIASPTSRETFWEMYSINESDYPAVFLIIKDGITDNAILYNKYKKPFRGQAHNLRYELLGSVDEEKINSFLAGDISLDDYIREWRNATQEESSFNDTTLFKNLGISEKELANAIRKLLIRAKANKEFSERFSKWRLDTIRTILDSPDAPKQKRLGALLTLCKENLITDDDFLEKLKPDEFLFVLKVYGRSIVNDKFISACKDAVLSTGEPVIEYIIRQQESLPDLAEVARPILRSAPQYVSTINNKVKLLVDKQVRLEQQVRHNIVLDDDFNDSAHQTDMMRQITRTSIIRHICYLIKNYRQIYASSERQQVTPEKKMMLAKGYTELLSLFPRHMIYSFDALKYYLEFGYYAEAGDIYHGIIEHDNDVSLDDVYQTVYKIYTKISTNERYKFYKLGDTMIYLLNRPDLAKKYLTEEDIRSMLNYYLPRVGQQLIIGKPVPFFQQLIIGKLVPLLAHFDILNKWPDGQEIILNLISHYRQNVSQKLAPLTRLLEKNNLVTPTIKEHINLLSDE